MGGYLSHTVSHTVTGTQLVTLGVVAALDICTALSLRVLPPDSWGNGRHGFCPEGPTSSCWGPVILQVGL